MTSKLYLIIFLICLIIQQSKAVVNDSPTREYPNFSNLENNATKTSAESQPQCMLYNSKTSKNFDVYKNCLKVVSEKSSKSSIAYVACDAAKNVTEILKNCTNQSEFEKKFILITDQKFLNLNRSDDWDISAIYAAFEPYTFPGVREYHPLKFKNGDFLDYIDNYSYYTDCLTEFGDSCTWYHQAKIITYFQQKGGVWINERKDFIEGKNFWDFCVPIVQNARFYGIFGLVLGKP